MLLPARSYVADASDRVDVAVAQCLHTLRGMDATAASNLKIVRLQPGVYDIDGRRVTITCRMGEVYVLEHGLRDGAAAEMPLGNYLVQAANVAASLGNSAVSRAPPERRLTFLPTGASMTQGQAVPAPNPMRLESMRRACEQADLREQAAQAFEGAAYFPPQTPVRPAIVPVFQSPLRGPPASSPFTPWLMAPRPGSSHLTPPRRGPKSRSPSPGRSPNMLVRL